MTRQTTAPGRARAGRRFGPRRRLLVLGGAVALIGVTAGPALAHQSTSTVTISPNQASFTTAQTVSLSGTATTHTTPLQGHDPIQAELKGPGGFDKVFQVQNPPTVGHTLQFGPYSFSTACGLDTACPAPTTANGAYTFSIVGDDAGGSQSFTVALPPATPAILAPKDGTQVAAGKLTVTWSKNTEPDLQGYNILANEKIVAQSLSPAVVCQATCSSSITAPTGTTKITVAAVRAGGNPSTQLASESTGATVHTPGAPATIPTTASGSGSGAAGAAGTSYAVSTGIALQLKDLQSIPNVGKLPPQVGVEAPQIAGSDGAAGSNDTFSPELSYNNQLASPTPAPRKGTTLSASDSGTSSTTASIWESVAASLCLLVAAGHIRRWMAAQRRAAERQPV
jgi:hypothetical protein